MASKGDIQATRSTAAAGASAIISQPIRLRGIIVASDGSGAGVLEDGILFPKGIFCKTKTNVSAYTLLTDKYSGPNLSAG